MNLRLKPEQAAKMTEREIAARQAADRDLAEFEERNAVKIAEREAAELEALRERIAAAEGKLDESLRCELLQHQQEIAHENAVNYVRRLQAADSTPNATNREFWRQRDESFEKLRRKYPGARAIELIEAAGKSVDASHFGRSPWAGAVAGLDAYERSRRRQGTKKASAGKRGEGDSTKDRVRAEAELALRKNKHQSRRALAQWVARRVVLKSKGGTARQLSEEHAEKLLRALKLPSQGSRQK